MLLASFSWALPRYQVYAPRPERVCSAVEQCGARSDQNAPRLAWVNHFG